MPPEPELSLHRSGLELMRKISKILSEELFEDFENMLKSQFGEFEEIPIDNNNLYKLSNFPT
jgi:hypothetical protein